MRERDIVLSIRLTQCSLWSLFGNLLLGRVKCSGNFILGWSLLYPVSSNFLRDCPTKNGSGLDKFQQAKGTKRSLFFYYHYNCVANQFFVPFSFIGKRKDLECTSTIYIKRPFPTPKNHPFPKQVWHTSTKLSCSVNQAFVRVEDFSVPHFNGFSTRQTNARHDDTNDTMVHGPQSTSGFGSNE